MSVSPAIVVTATPPTPNGDMHLGHLSGPYLNADVYSRNLRRRGHRVHYVTGGDDNQSYLVTTAERLGRPAAQVAGAYNRQIVDTLRALEIELDLYSIPDSGYANFVNEFFLSLYRRGRLVAKTTQFLRCGEHGRFLYEGYTKGFCPLCLKNANGNICESCGHPNHPADLIHARCSADRTHRLERQPLTLLYLEVEKYRDALRAFYDRSRPLWRPRLSAFADDLLARPLADLPVSFPANWGIAVPISGFAGQVWNSWAEMFPALLFAAKRGGGEIGDGAHLAQFLGFDNAYWFCAAHPALALAAQMPHALPKWILTNEFYLLENEKFSTSRGHAIWGGDFLKDCPSTHLRFYLALTNPELQETNFAVAEMAKTVNARLVDPWNRFRSSLERLERTNGRAADRAPTAPDILNALSRVRQMIERAYEPRHFSLRAAADAGATMIAFIAEHAEGTEGGGYSRAGVAERLRALRYGLRAVADALAPLLPSFATAVCGAVNKDGNAVDVDSLADLTLPRVTLDSSMRGIRRAA
jgi:methionyl-tRNA synthetase